MSANPTLISTVRDVVVKIVNGDGTTNKTLAIAPPAAGSRIKALHITSDDTVLRTFQLIKTISSVDYIIGEIDVPVGAGTDGATNAVNGLAGTRMPALQTDGLVKWIDIATGTTLNFKPKVAVTAGKTVYIVAEVGDFT
jgi:hypothetical protein